MCSFSGAEIPTGLYLLRRISRRSLRQHFPHMNHNYRKFFASCLVRIANGYFFLLNVLMVLVQATGVLDSELLRIASSIVLRARC